LEIGINIALLRVSNVDVRQKLFLSAEVRRREKRAAITNFVTQKAFFQDE